ncbi:diguanylate cyclase [Klebsiella pneumoniae]|nr:diguanylate cyclase [Klebsiella pneumoniae]
MDKPLRLKLKKCYHLARPAHVVNACFIAVLFFSTLLIWREINVLEEAYVANQRNNLANVAHEMDGLLQFNIDRMMFFRHGMQAALEQPLDIDVLRKASQRYLSQRHQQAWRVGHCCKVSDEAAFCLIQRPYISKTLLTRRISPRGSP